MTAIVGAAAVLFDKDGTLFDFHKSWGGLSRRVIEELAEGDAALAERLAAVVGFDLPSGRYTPHSPIVSGSLMEVVVGWAELLPGRSPSELAKFLEMRARALAPTEMTPAAEDLPGLLARLRAAGLALGVATHDAESAARAQLSAIGAAAAFDFIAGYDSGHALKPDAAMLRAFSAAVGAPAEAIVVVGDSLHDLGMGRAGGALATVGVLTGPAGLDDLSPLADHILASIDDLPALLGAPLA